MLISPSLIALCRWLVLPLLLGALFSLALKPFAIWPLAIISIAGFYALLRHYSQFALRIGFFYGLGFFLSGVYWVYSAMTMVNSPKVAAVTITLGFCAALAILFVLQAGIFSRLFLRKPQQALSFAALWLLFEWLRTWLFTGFPWLLTGYSLSDSIYGQWASVLGVYGLSFILVLFSCVLVESLHKNNGAITASFILIVSTTLGGSWLQQQTFGEEIGSINIASIQTAIEQKTKWNETQIQPITELTTNMTKSIEGADLILWAESAITDRALNTLAIVDQMDQWALQNNQALLVGIARADLQHKAYFNSMIGLGRADGIYNKQRLVPFGEYLPFEQHLRNWLFFLDLPPSNFKAGDKQQLGNQLHLPRFDAPIDIASLVCYEAAYSHLTRRLSRDKHIIITATNDDWFGGSIASDQHLQIAQMRAIENRLSTVRATQSGHTVFIDAFGKIQQALPQFQRGVLQGEVVLRQSMTPYQRLGGLYQIWLAAMILMLVLIRVFISKQKQKNRD